MKVLLLGANGNIGLRLIPALLNHNHDVIAFVRSPEKLKTLVPETLYERITIVQGDATSVDSIKAVILDDKCEAAVNAAGNASVLPWSKNTLAVIFPAVLQAMQEAGVARKSPMRVWFLGGFSALNYPGADSMLSDHLPIYIQHSRNLQKLKSLPPNLIDWTMLCPSQMTPESEANNNSTTLPRGQLIVSANIPPLWRDSWVKSIPFLGKILAIGLNASRYNTTLEQNADLIAKDLTARESFWSGKAIGTIENPH